MMAQRAELISYVGEGLSVKPFCRGLMKAKAGGKCGLMDNNGRMAVAMENDQITDFFDGTAFILKKSDSGVVLKGIVTENGHITLYDKVYYIVPGEVFFSEGMMPVSDSSGKIGFITPDGRLAIKCSYRQVLPFSEGYACVWTDKLFLFINKQGKALGIDLPNGGYPCDGRSFHKGTAYVADEEHEWFSINKNGTSSSVRGKSRNFFNQYDYLGRLGTDAPGEVKYLPKDNDGGVKSNVYSFKENGLVGYRTSNNVVVPCQFTEGSEFVNGFATVKLNGKSGLLRLIEDSWPPKVKPVSGVNETYTAITNMTCKFHVDFPNDCNAGRMKVSVMENGKNLDVKSAGGSDFTFSYRPLGQSQRENRQFSVVVHDGEIIQAKVPLACSLMRKHLLQLQIAVGEVESNDRATVTVYVSNSNEMDVTTTVSLAGSSPAFHPISQEVTVPGGGRKSLSSFFDVKKTLTDQWVEATTSEGGSARKSGLTLNAYTSAPTPTPINQPLTIAIQVGNVEADASGKCHVTAVIHNPNSTPVNTVVTMSGSDSFVGKRENVSIPANSKKTVSSYFQIKGAKLNQWVEVSTSSGAKARKDVPQLRVQ